MPISSGHGHLAMPPPSTHMCTINHYDMHCPHICQCQRPPRYAWSTPMPMPTKACRARTNAMPMSKKACCAHAHAMPRSMPMPLRHVVPSHLSFASYNISLALMAASLSNNSCHANVQEGMLCPHTSHAKVNAHATKVCRASILFIC